LRPETAAPDLLARIAARRRERLGTRPGGPAAAAGAAAAPGPAPRAEPLTAAENPFLDALTRRRGRAVIAEIKLGSPRWAPTGPAEPLAGGLAPERLAELYGEHGAAALSVVVEPDFFQGSYDLLRACQRASGLPAIAKDFVVDARQLEWARDAGADAVLLIAALCTPEELRSFAGRARALGLAPLVETRDEDDLAMLAGESWELVGVNSRDLRTFDVDLGRAVRLAPRLPATALKVAESGIAAAGDVARLRAAGFDAFLVGESLLRAADAAAKLRELSGE
jgi:indole-3-glycerol phosphate synthase